MNVKSSSEKRFVQPHRMWVCIVVPWLATKAHCRDCSWREIRLLSQAQARALVQLGPATHSTWDGQRNTPAHLQRVTVFGCWGFVPCLDIDKVGAPGTNARIVNDSEERDTSDAGRTFLMPAVLDNALPFEATFVAHLAGVLGFAHKTGSDFRMRSNDTVTRCILQVAPENKLSGGYQQ